MESRADEQRLLQLEDKQRGEACDASVFVKRFRAALAGRLAATVALQHDFILHRRSMVTWASECVDNVADEWESRAGEQRLLELEPHTRRREARDAAVVPAELASRAPCGLVYAEVFIPFFDF